MKEWEPTLQQELLVDHLLEGNNITDSAKLAGICRDAYYKWIKIPEFKRYIVKRREENSNTRMAKVDKKLFEETEAGDVAAMRLLYERFDGLKLKVADTEQGNQKPGEGQSASDKLAALLDKLNKGEKIVPDTVEAVNE